MLYSLYFELLDELLSLSDYQSYKSICKEIKRNGFSCPRIFNAIYFFRMGYLDYLSRKAFLVIKYRLLGTSIG